MTSMPPPGGKGTITSIGRAPGQARGCAPNLAGSMAPAEASRMLRRFTVTFLPDWRWSCRPTRGRSGPERAGQSSPSQPSRFSDASTQDVSFAPASIAAICLVSAACFAAVAACTCSTWS